MRKECSGKARRHEGRDQGVEAGREPPPLRPPLEPKPIASAEAQVFNGPPLARPPLDVGFPGRLGSKQVVAEFEVVEHAEGM